MKRPRHTLVFVVTGLLLVLVAGYSAIRSRPKAERAVAPPPAGPVQAPDLWGGNGRYRTMGWQGVDLRQADFSQVDRSGMWALTYSTQTKWPEPSRLPAGFDPQNVLETGQDPGLGIRELHRRGITGKGIRVAVIDSPMLKGHQEFEGRITYTMIDPKHEKVGWIYFHGAAAASLLAGKTVGVAPESHVYFYAVPGSLGDFPQVAAAIDQVLAFNQGRPKAEQIRVLSISMGLPNPVFKAAIREAEQAGIAVVHCGNWFSPPYTTAGVSPDRDRNDPLAMQSQRLSTTQLYVPADYRTTASSDGPAVYAYWGEGGASWAAPWVAGLITLGMQVNPDLTPAEAYEALEQTAIRTEEGTLVPSPAGFIARVERR